MRPSVCECLWVCDEMKWLIDDKWIKTPLNSNEVITWVILFLEVIELRPLFVHILCNFFS